MECLQYPLEMGSKTWIEGDWAKHLPITHNQICYCQFRQDIIAQGFLLVQEATLDTFHHPVASCNVLWCSTYQSHTNQTSQINQTTN